ncbi:MAG: hypothetical protein GY953_34275, partial [bacterium]|nr:hypothetical protein [bacterium]
MSARFLNPSVEIEPGGRTARVHFRLENRSRKTWGRADGFYLGWQLFDPETSLFIREGQWQPLAEDLAPGSGAEHTLEIELPAERGHYHVYISPLEEEAGWHYRKGSPFLLLDASVDAGRAAVES